MLIALNIIIPTFTVGSALFLILKAIKLVKAIREENKISCIRCEDSESVKKE